jgi:hypothetical protein
MSLEADRARMTEMALHGSISRRRLRGLERKNRRNQAALTCLSYVFLHKWEVAVDEYQAKVAELSARAAVEANLLIKKELEVLIASYRRLAEYAKDNSVVGIEIPTALVSEEKKSEQ